ncbi:MAG: hypothetical protein AM325_007115 [Candidatus Thorarchaeota archaeon SMTZ1-45]|nr:MAG: hypothetical protein AM325_08845 [Candidatus Thorarchaeota archaeon SMTZ1-45]
MCGEHRGHRYHGHFTGPFMHSWGCAPYEQSRETKIKSLEAFKSKLEDHIKHIDEKIAELEKENAQEA